MNAAEILLIDMCSVVHASGDRALHCGASPLRKHLYVDAEAAGNVIGVSDGLEVLRGLPGQASRQEHHEEGDLRHDHEALRVARVSVPELSILHCETIDWNAFGPLALAVTDMDDDRKRVRVRNKRVGRMYDLPFCHREDTGHLSRAQPHPPASCAPCRGVPKARGAD